MSDKIIQIVPVQGFILCLSEQGRIYQFDPHNNIFEYLNEGIQQSYVPKNSD